MAVGGGDGAGTGWRAAGGIGTSPCTALLLNPHWQADLSPEGSVGRNLTVAWQ